MLAEKSVSEETLRRLWSEIALLRREVEQAERGKTGLEVGSTPYIAAAQDDLKRPTERHR